SLDEMDTSIISELSNTENGVKIKLADKMKAMEMLAKYTDLLSDNDKKRLQEEKLKADTAKAKAEADKLAKESKKVAPPTITIVFAWSDDDTLFYFRHSAVGQSAFYACMDNIEVIQHLSWR